MKRYFVTGTDTDCGKTYVTVQLAQFFTNAVAIKPVASGCLLIDNHLVSADAQKLQKISNLPLEVINPWRYHLAVSPHIAAKEEHSRITIRELSDYCLNIQLPGVDTLFIEGAGGLFVPLNENETWIDFLVHTEIPVILVVGLKLGCINHALLSATALEINKIKCIGWIANCPDPEMLALSENIATLKRMLKVPLLATIPFSGTLLEFND